MKAVSIDIKERREYRNILKAIILDIKIELPNDDAGLWNDQDGESKPKIKNKKPGSLPKAKAERAKASQGQCRAKGPQD